MDLLLNGNSVTSNQNLKGVNHLYDHVDYHGCSFKSLGVASGNYFILLASVLMNNLPQELKLVITIK